MFILTATAGLLVPSAQRQKELLLVHKIQGRQPGSPPAAKEGPTTVSGEDYATCHF